MSVRGPGIIKKWSCRNGNERHCNHTFYKRASWCFQSGKNITDRCILQHINLKIYDTIKVTELEKQFYLSESALRRRFKEEVGISINEYVNQRKIEESKMMLQSGVPVGEIARRLSFYDLSHYYRTFKKYTGMAPQYFRDTNVVA